MKVFQTEYTKLGLWSHTDLAYITHDPKLDPFLAYPPDKNIFTEVISNRKKYRVDRELLTRVIKKQYTQLGMELPVDQAVLLDDNTFTITTAHQPNLLTGPLYHIYKIASTINITRQLKETISGHHFIPVFIIGGEDHDWPEVNHFHLFGRKYQWDRTATGPCGRLSLEGLDSVIETVTALFEHTPHGADIREKLNTCLSRAENYGQFHQLLVHSLFSVHGLVILNMDDPELKRAFIPLMEKEIKEQFSLPHVSSTQNALERVGFKAQAYCRPVNLFYMTPGLRERIDPVANGFIRVDSGITYSLSEIMEELHQYPERFSPNVIMRPLYEETILPNLAYIGGGGEIAYWLERKAQFEAANVHFPMLVRRNSVMLIDQATAGQMQKSELTWEDLMLDQDALVKTYLLRHSHTDLEFAGEMQMINEAYTSLAAKADKLDPTLSKAILAEETKQLKQFEQLASRLMRAEKQLQDTNIKRIQKLKEKLFPENGLQERHENFLSIYAQYGATWIAEMITLCDPFVEKFTVAEL